jgi:protein phosphatase
VETNAEIHRRGMANPDFHAMGTTASVLVLSPRGALAGHVGDSRIYRLRGDQLEQLTFDHSLQWELRSMGRLPEGSDLARSIPKNVITRSLGPNASVTVDLEGPFPLELGDTFLLCSDGLSGQVSDEEIGNLLAYLPPAEAATVLIDLANLRGGPDNITVIVAQIVDEALATSQTSDDRALSDCAPRRPAVDIAPWIVTGACLLFAFFLWFAEQTVPATVFAGAAIVAAVAGITLYVRKRGPRKRSFHEDGYLGKAPYVTVPCAGGDEFAGTLAAVLDELREAAKESKWEVRWEDFDALQRGAEKAQQSKDFPQAIRNYAKAISFIMDELRHQQNRLASESSIDF